MGNKDKTDAIQELRTHLLQAQTRFGQLLEAAETDSYEVWEMRHQWQKFQRLSTDFAGTMAGWHGNFIELQMLDVKGLIPNLETFGKELEVRFAQIESMLKGQPPEHRLNPIDLMLDKTGIQTLSHFHRAALAVTRKRLNHLETLSRSLFETVYNIQGFDQKAKVPVAKPQPSGGFVFDPDRLTGASHVMIILWLAYLAVIYVPDIPGGGALVSMAGVFGMILAGTPQLPVSKMFMPVAGSVLYGAVIHIFVMPQRAVNVATIQYQEGYTDFNTLVTTLNANVQQQDLLSAARGEVATNLVQVYKSLGGGWQIRDDRDPVDLLPEEMKDEMIQRTKAWDGVLSAEKDSAQER